MRGHCNECTNDPAESVAMGEDKNWQCQLCDDDKPLVPEKVNHTRSNHTDSMCVTGNTDRLGELRL